MTQPVNPIDLPQGLPKSPPSDNSSESNHILTPLSAIMQQEQTHSMEELLALVRSTKRTKRKRQGSDAHLPRRPSPPSANAVMLDYGSDSQSLQDESKYSTTPTATKQDMPPPPDSREEGEISDEDDIPLPPPTNASTSFLPPKPQLNGRSSAPVAQAPPVSTTSSYMSLASDLPQQSSIRVNNTQSLSPTFPPQAQNISPWTNWAPTEDHVRPGLRSESNVAFLSHSFER